jgi:hypothetical protein
MNNTLEPSRPHSEWGEAQSEDSAEAAQRDLFEFFTSEAVAPPLVADEVPQDAVPQDAEPQHVEPQGVEPQGDPAPPSVPDHPGAARAWSGATPDEHADPASACAHRDADSDACELAARSAAQEVDEATRENLRRLEATMSWLQNEVRHLPRAPQISPARGVHPAQSRSSPAFDAIIDRSTLHRTVHGSSVHSSAPHGSSPLPIWLREHEAPIRLPSPRRGRGRELWRRLVKFFWACAVAAPIAYVFAITTSPLHKHLGDIAGLASAISRSLPTQHDAQPSGRELIAISPLAVEAAVGGAVAAAAPSVGDRAGPPETAHAPPAAPVIVVMTEVGETRSKSAPADDSAAATKPAAPQDTGALVEQGRQFFDIGDLVAARILFMRAAKAGDAAAAIAMGATYDPVALAERGVRGVASDLDKARAWYERGKDMGSSEGPRRLEMLANR